MKRKNIYVLLTILALAAIAAALVFQGNHGEEQAPAAVKGAAASEKTAAPAASQDSGSSGNETAPAGIRENERSSYSYVMSMVRNPTLRPQFGDFRLVSVIVNDAEPESSTATIEDRKTGAGSIYSIHEKLPDDSELVEIRQSYVVVEKSGVRRRINFSSQGIRRSSVRMRLNPDTGYAKTGENEFALNPYRVFRGDADRVLDFFLEADVRDGKMDGIRLSGIRDNTMAQELGLREGDVLLAVNGTSVDSILSGVRACMNAYYSDELQMKIRRGDRVINTTYHLFWEGQGSWTPVDVLNSKAVSSLFASSVLLHLF
jgi:hypothetical protein